jgi:S1-C subfamily serine protease
MGEKNIPENKTRTKSALVSLSEEIQNVADKVSQSVVSVRSRTRGIGSGVVWTSDGLIVTCSHIVRKLVELEVSLSNGRSFPAKVIGNDPYSDIALLKIQANGKSFVTKDYVSRSVIDFSQVIWETVNSFRIVFYQEYSLVFNG